MNEPIIQEYTAKDKAACMAIFESNIPQYFMESERPEFEEWLNKPDRAPYYILLQQNEIIACGGIYEDKEKKTAGLAWGMVSHKLHKQGFGKLLTEHRLVAMNALFPGLEQHLETSQHTEAFYRKFGFEVIEVVKSGFGEGMDNYKMRKPAS